MNRAVLAEIEYIVWWESPVVIMVAAAVAAIAFGWLVLAKIATRICRRLGVETPCPYWLGWILLLRPGRWMRPRILDRIGIEMGESILEVGCGVGVFTRDIARRAGESGRVIAVDVQPRMVDATIRRLKRTGPLHPRVETRIADARNLPFEDASFNRIILISAFPEMPEKPAVLREIARVLAPGGTLSVTEEFFDPDMFFPSETQQIIEAHGFARISCRGCFLTTYTMNFQSELRL